MTEADREARRRLRALLRSFADHPLTGSIADDRVRESIRIESERLAPKRLVVDGGVDVRLTDVSVVYAGNPSTLWVNMNYTPVDPTVTVTVGLADDLGEIDEFPGMPEGAWRGYVD